MGLNNLLSHPALQKIREVVEKQPYGKTVHVVGGAVRDSILGRGFSTDFDLVVQGDALRMAEDLFSSGICSIKPVVYPRFGTALCLIGGTEIELVSARSESYESFSRKPKVKLATLIDDAKRRDFTCNTLMLNLINGELMDFLENGLSDLKSGILRTPLDAQATFIDDPLRMMRALRFRAQLNFEYADGLLDAIRANSNRLGIVSGERIRQEYEKIILSPHATRAHHDLLETKLLGLFFPEMVELVGVEQGDYHHLDAFDHTLLVLKNARPDTIILALACILHDIGKPSTKTVDIAGKIRFFGHESIGAEMSVKIMRRMKFGHQEIDAVRLLVQNHMRIGSFEKATKPAARRLVRDLGDQLDNLFKLVDADANGLKTDIRKLDFTDIHQMVKSVKQNEDPKQFLSPLNGVEIMEITGLTPGPLIKTIQTMLTEKVIEGELDRQDRKKSYQMVKDWFSEHKSKNAT